MRGKKIERMPRVNEITALLLVGTFSAISIPLFNMIWKGLLMSYADIRRYSPRRFIIPRIAI